MKPILNDIEARIIGCLMEKSIVTPDQYPLTLNALVNACNQKSSRNPVMSLEKGEVQRAARELASKHLLMVEENFRNGVERFEHRFCNTAYGDYQFDSAQFAIVCLLLLRGPQTPGELRARSGRLHDFPDNTAVSEVLDGLMNLDGEPLVVRLPITPGRRDCEYMHLFCGPVEGGSSEAAPRTERSAPAPSRVTIAELVDRVSRLELEVAELRQLLESQAEGENAHAGSSLGD
ncbi:MAG: DUF480 domain-containing protein [Proteobacteria bacterium]|nr:MAG: DUF480 domain-containing protein [Pseudomonadota bacterium]